MNELLLESRLAFINPETSSRAKAQADMLASILNAPTLAQAASVAGLSGHRVSWGRYEENPYHQEGWHTTGLASRHRLQAAGAYMTALAYVTALPRLRCPERRARVLRVVENCAVAIEMRAFLYPSAQRDADAAEVRALVAGK